MAKIAILRCLLVILPPYLNVFMQKKIFIIYRRDARKGSSAYSPKPHIAVLKEKGVIRRVGEDKNGYWEVLIAIDNVV